MEYMHKNSALIYEIALIQQYCPDFWAKVVSKGNFKFDTVPRYKNISSQISDYICNGFPEYRDLKTVAYDDFGDFEF